MRLESAFLPFVQTTLGRGG